MKSKSVSIIIEITRFKHMGFWGFGVVSLPSEAVELLSILETRGHLKRGQEELCHNFQLSIRAELRGKG